MALTSVNIRLDEEDKKIFNEICSQLGLNMSVAFNMFVKSMIRTGGLPFDTTIKNYNLDTMYAIKEGEEILSGEGNYPIYEDVEEFLISLKKEEKC